ncbi:Molybdopterin synthase sulfur carrier subunit [Sphaceloma murrayae]|uniref:Molybdopterin synthase sulfur carrier subunit n=1 Tax=Sphaceloma murrayae TaxID=2082308 RepID=A0A2K1QL46_9PEZI|nr:Molybdopterin synthase sulfur carrier subunit [Sphaceloma murrayae]
MASPSVPSGSFTLLYFASAQSFTRRDREAIPGPMSPAQLFQRLEESYPGIHSKGAHSTTIQPGDEVAIIPPVSSG